MVDIFGVIGGTVYSIIRLNNFLLQLTVALQVYGVNVKDTRGGDRMD